MEAKTEGTPALLYMLVMFFLIFIVVGSITTLLVPIITTFATQGIMRLELFSEQVYQCCSRIFEL